MGIRLHSGEFSVAEDGKHGDFWDGLDAASTLKGCYTKIDQNWDLTWIILSGSKKNSHWLFSHKHEAEILCKMREC